MIKIGTLFSGIGSPEMALKYLGLDYETIFACDNGGVEIDVSPEEIETIKNLNTAKDQKEYVEKLYSERTRKTNFVKISYLENHKINNDMFFEDIKLFDGTKFKNQIDILVGGSPCQSFSMIGKRGGLEDTRGTLFYDYARVVKEIEPKVFIFENVYGLLNHNKGKTWEVIQNVFKGLGYHFKYEIINSKDVNIPQNRRRLFVVGFKDKEKNINFKFPKPKELKFTMQDFLLDNAKESCFIRENEEINIIKKPEKKIEEKLYLSEKLKKYVMSPGTKNFYHPNAETDLPIARALLSTMGNSHRSSINNYVTTNGKLRALAPRETARLMGYDDNFKIIVSKAQAYKQFGNSIVVDVMMELLKSIVKELENE